MKRLSDVLEELCPGVRQRNWPAWAGNYEDAMKLETERYYVQQEGSGWTVRHKSSGDVMCLRSTEAEAIAAMEKAESPARSQPEKERPGE